MPAEHAILGLLMLDGEGAHGYDLARHFGEGQPLGSVLRLEPSMLYHHLKKLARAGWVTSSKMTQGARPTRQVYQISNEGRDEIFRWLRDPVERTREIRLEFLVKLYFARQLDQELATRLIAEQRATCQRIEESLQAQLEELGSPADDDARFSSEVLSLRLAQTRAAMNWIDQLDEVHGP
jgi:PadR family transcriptional regulator, regulatory protein AphA